jgi:hypothetical protein
MVGGTCRWPLTHGRAQCIVGQAIGRTLPQWRQKDCIPVLLGVKPGCPFSPLLFGIFMDDFELHGQRTVSPALAQLPRLCGSPVPPLMFADDMLLISTSAAGLNAQLQSLQT